MKKLLIILLTCFSICCNAQTEPGNNLGKSLSTMRREFPELRYLGTDEKGDEYEDGYPEDGIAVFFYFKNNVVIEECMICQSTDGFPKEWYNSLIKQFDARYYSKISKSSPNAKRYSFSSFDVNIIFFSEQGTNTALIVYERTIGKTSSSAPAPKTNLGKTLSQIKSEFPYLKYEKTENGKQEYSSGAHTFIFKEGKVVCDSYVTYGSSTFQQFIKQFSGTNFISETEMTHDRLGMNKTFFFKDYRITVMLWQMDNEVLVTYQHSDYFKK